MTAMAGRPHSLSPTGLLVLGWAGAIIAGAIFLSLSWQVATYAPIVALDARIADWLHKHGTPEVTAFMIAVTMFHSIAGSSVLAAILGIVLYRLRERYWLLTLALAMVGGIALNTVLKYAYARNRPYFDDPWVSLSTYSFPSGHTAAAVLFYGVLAAFLASRFHDWRQRAVCVAGPVLAVTLVAFSRMYLGAHYLSDVLAAACSSAVWLVLCLSSVHALVRRRNGSAMPQRGFAWRAIGIGIAAVAIALATMYLPDAWVEKLEGNLNEMDVEVAFAAFCAASIAGTLLLVPVSIFHLVAGAVFGFVLGTAAALASSVGAALIAFLVSRHLLRGRVKRFVQARKNFKALDGAVANEGWKIVALMRLSPIGSSSVKSYFFGLTRVDFRDYATASVVGFLPGLLLRVYIGDAGRSALQGGLLEWGFLALGIVATIAASVILRRVTGKRLAFGT
jgi:undecaprenyl-diphosphatase